MAVISSLIEIVLIVRALLLLADAQTDGYEETQEMKKRVGCEMNLASLRFLQTGNMRNKN